MEAGEHFFDGLSDAIEKVSQRQALVIEKLTVGAPHFRVLIHEMLSQNNRMRAFDLLMNIPPEIKQSEYIDAVLLAGRFLLCNYLVSECYIFLRICHEKILSVYKESASFTLYEEIGNMFYLSGQPDLAIIWYEKLMEMSEAPESIMYFNIGMCFQVQEDYKKAIENYVKSTYADPKYYKSWVNLGYCYLHDSRPDKALAAFQQLPLSGENLVCIGNAQFRQGNFEEAIALYLRSVELKEDPGTYNNLGIALKKVGLFQDAINAFNDSLSLKPNAEAVTNLLTLYLELGKKSEAQSLFKLCGKIIKDEDSRLLSKLFEQYFPQRRTTIVARNSNELAPVLHLGSARKSIMQRISPLSPRKTPNRSSIPE